MKMYLLLGILSISSTGFAKSESEMFRSILGRIAGKLYEPYSACMLKQDGELPCAYEAGEIRKRFS